jgi:hypothetical protein
MTDKKNSILVSQQLPGFIREDYPKFISFLEAYYEFLEQEQFTNGISQKNDLLTKSKDLRYVSDVDYISNDTTTLDKFEEQFFNSFLPFIPRDAAVNKELLIKNIMPVLLAKGSEKSYKLLFRMLFDSSATLTFPKDNILKASDGRWTQEQILRLTTNVYTEYIGDGERVTFYLPDVYDSLDVLVLLDGSLTSQYEFRKETKKIIFTTAPTEGQVIRFYYTGIGASGYNLVANRQFVGKQSGATALIERGGLRTISGTNFYEFFLDTKLLIGNFKNGELVDVIVKTENGDITLTYETYSDLESITIVDGGASYNVGDPVNIQGTAIEDAIAVVDRVASGQIEAIQVVSGGHGFRVNDNVRADGYSTNVFSGRIISVDNSGTKSPNTLQIFTDLISSIDIANVTIDTPNYGLPLNAGNNTVILNGLSNTVISVGPITAVNVGVSLISSAINPIFDAISANVGNTGLNVNDFGIVATIQINNGGTNYQVNDVITFLNNGVYPGYGANGRVTSVDANGTITGVLVTNGGLGYIQNDFPPLAIISANGTSANLQVDSVMGNGENLNGITVSGDVAGKILSIRILDSGVGYANVPGVFLSDRGDGNATAFANIRNTIVEIPGRWSTSDGLLSSKENVLQGRDYFIDFSYVISSKVEFNRYKTLLKNLLHPAGLVNFAVFENTKIIDSNVVISTTDSFVAKQLAGTANVRANSVIVTGTNTFFQTMNTATTLSIGDTIVVNNETRVIVSISGETSLNVNNVFTYSSNNQFIKLVV